MWHTWKSAPHFENEADFKKCAAHLEKCGTLGKVQHSWKSAAYLEKCTTLGK